MSMSNEEVRSILKKMEDKRAEETQLKGLGFRDELRTVGGNKNLGNLLGSKKSMKGGQAVKLGEQYARKLLEKKPLKGGESFWDGFKRGFNSVIKPVAKVVKAVAPLAGPYGQAVKLGLDAVGYGQTTGGISTGGISTGGRKKRQPKQKQKRKLSEKQIKRNALVKQIMKEEGLSLPQASKYIKENQLM